MTSWRTKALPPLLAIVFAVLLSAIALIISGADPLQAYGTMIGQMFKGSTSVDTVNLATVYYLSGLAVAIGFQMNLFNIGVEGQYRFAGRGRDRGRLDEAAAGTAHDRDPAGGGPG